jgi:hypothetical protein
MFMKQLISRDRIDIKNHAHEGHDVDHPGNGSHHVETINRSPGIVESRQSTRNNCAKHAIMGKSPVAGINEKAITEKSKMFHPSRKYRAQNDPVDQNKDNDHTLKPWGVDNLIHSIFRYRKLTGSWHALILE